MPAPRIDFADLPAPEEGILVTLLSPPGVLRSRGTSTRVSWAARWSWTRIRAVGQFTGLLRGKLAAKRPEDLPG